ncbi:MAG: choice-of-anchor D domain-containing protein, partial [Kiritimatiellales bacterium]
MKTIKLIILLVVVLSLSAMAFHNVIPNPDGDFSGEFQTMNVGDDYFYFVPNKTGQAGFQVTNPRAGIGFAHDLKLYVQETSGWKLLAEKSSSSKDVAIVDVTLWAGKLYKLQYDEPYAYVDTATIIGHIPVEIVGYRVVDTLLDENGDKTYTGEWINPGADFDYYDYTAPESGTLNVDTLDSTLGFDTDLFVFKKNMSGNWYLYDSDSGDADNGGVSFLVSKGSRYVFVVGSSDLETGEYEITFNGPPLPKLSAPRISPDGGTHVGSCDISLSSYPSDSTIRYTIDDTDPTKSSTEYTGSFTISSSCTVKAKVFKAGYTASDSSSTYFTITPAPTRIISLSGDLDFPQTQVGLSVSVPGALKISNTGNSSLNITGISYPSGFSGENWKGTILDGGEKNITVTFSPAAARDYNGTITVNSDNRTGGENTITCTGLGLKGSASTVVITVPSSNPYSTGSSSMTFFGLAPSGSTRVGYVNSKTGRSDSDWDAVETDGTWGGRPISFDVGDNPITITAYNAQGGFTGSGSITVKRQNNIKTAPASRVACQDIRSDASKPHPEPYVGYCTDQYFGTERVLIKFNLPVLPNGSKVTGAVLGARTDWENYGTPFTIHAYRINDSWSQSVTWNSFVNGGSSNPYDKTSPVISNPENVPNAENVNVSWNVTDIYKDWSAGIEDNNGIILIAESNVDSGRQGYCDRSFDVSRFSLTVTYEAETTPPSITISSPVSDATYTTRNSTVDLSGTASDSQNFVASVTWKNQQTEKSGTCSGTESWSVSGIALNEGENLIIVTATDSVGNKTDTQIAVIYNHPQKILRLSGDLTFGSVVVGNTTTADLVICNDGDTPLTVTGISYPLGFSGDESGGEIPSGGSKTVSVSFVPDVVQEYSDTITVNSDKTSGNNMINCSGTGIKATRILRLGGDLDFGEIITNQHAFGELTIYNDGNSSLSVTNIDYPSGFSGNWTGVVEAVRSHSIPVLFEPVLVQDYSGTITVYSDPTSGSNTITCSGFGTQLPYPDLIITNVSYTAGTYQAGDVFTVTASEMNRSEDVDVTETFTNQAVLSTSKIWGDVSNILVYEGIENEGMDAGEEYSVTNSIPVPASIPAGSYYLGIMADVNDDVEESIETNNVWWSDSADIVVADGGGNPPDWQPPSGKPYSMIVYATVDLDGSPIESSGSSLAAFYGDGSVVGVTDVITGPSGKLYQMTVFSDLVAESGLSLKVYDASSGEIHDIVETLDFASDTELGSLPSPITYHAGFKQCVLNLVEGYNWISFNVLP